MIERKRLARGFRLEEWIIRPEDGSLKSGEKSTRLEPLLMDLLVYLCSRAGEVIPKDDVLNTIWGGRFVSDDTIKGSFYQLRKTLGDDPREPRFIETLPKRGYRMRTVPVPLEPASDLLAKGQAALASESNPAALKQAALYFERFLESEGEHAAALAGLARAYISLAILGAPGDLWSRAKSAAQRATELDAKFGEARLAMAAIRAVMEHDPQGALAEMDTAPDLNTDPVALRWRARLLAAVGQGDRAVADARRAVELDSLSVPARRDLVEVLFLTRRYRELESEAQRLFELAPSAADVHLGMVWVNAVQGRDREAFDAYERGLHALGIPPAQIEQAREAFRRGGLPEILRLWAALLESAAAIGQKTHNDLLVLYALAGDADRSFAMIEASFVTGNPFLLNLAESPVFDKLRGDARYEQWLRGLGLKK